MHHIDKCVHGIIVSQCRCPDANKPVNIVPCPPSCQENIDSVKTFHPDFNGESY